MSELINWMPNGHGGYLGRSGEWEPFLFQISRDGDGPWVLAGTLPGHCAAGRLSDSADPAKLKRRAEDLLREFASSIGAVFPAPPELLRFDGTRCDQEVKAPDSEYDQCPAKSRYRVERSDHDPGASRPPEYGPAEACEAHLSDTVCALVDGDDRLTAVVRVRWT